MSEHSEQRRFPPATVKPKAKRKYKSLFGANKARAKEATKKFHDRHVDAGTDLTNRPRLLKTLRKFLHPAWATAAGADAKLARFIGIQRLDTHGIKHAAVSNLQRAKHAFGHSRWPGFGQCRALGRFARVRGAVFGCG